MIDIFDDDDCDNDGDNDEDEDDTDDDAADDDNDDDGDDDGDDDDGDDDDDDDVVDDDDDDDDDDDAMPSWWEKDYWWQGHERTPPHSAFRGVYVNIGYFCLISLKYCTLIMMQCLLDEKRVIGDRTTNGHHCIQRSGGYMLL